MGMSVYELVAKEIYDVHYIVMLLFLSYLGIEKHMEEYIAELL